MKSLKRKSKEERDIETRERRRDKEVIPLLSCVDIKREGSIVFKPFPRYTRFT